MLSADELWKLYNSNNSKKSIWTIDSVGEATSCQGRIITQLKHPETGAKYWMQKYLDNGSVNYAGLVKEDTILRDINMLAGLSTKKHTDATKDNRWRHIYWYDNYNCRYMKSNGTIGDHQIKGCPCHFCGVILPDHLIQVDHRQPQKSPHLAVLKCMHMLPSQYVLRPGQGTKSTQLQALKGLTAFSDPADVALALTRSAPNKRDIHPILSFVSADLTQNVEKAARYSITLRGQTFYSILRMYLGETGADDLCLDNILNLVPACSRCNGRALKTAKLHAQPSAALPVPKDGAANKKARH